MVKDQGKLKVCRKGVMPDGTAIQIEDWSDVYPDIYPQNNTLAAYPISKWSIPGAFAPKAGEQFRAGFDFPDCRACAKAFEDLTSGTKTLADFVDRLERHEYRAAILGGAV